jgi:hypothetical protein
MVDLFGILKAPKEFLCYEGIPYGRRVIPDRREGEVVEFNFNRYIS